MVHCGHTFCTECLSQLHHNYRIRCPLCRKLIKNLETVERLPLNINILYEVVSRDPLLSKMDFDDDAMLSEQNLEEKLCIKHQERVKHFYCSNHKTVFCRECIKEKHIEDSCFVVDLYEIEKMRKLQQQNTFNNKKQLKKRKDGANQSCVVTDPFYNEEAVLKMLRPSPNPLVVAATAQQTAKLPPKAMPKEPPLTEEFLKYSYGDEEPTDEARTNEEMLEEIEKIAQLKYMIGEERAKQMSNCVLFNGEDEDEEGGESKSSQGEDDEGSFEEEEEEEEIQIDKQGGQFIEVDDY